MQRRRRNGRAGVAGHARASIAALAIVWLEILAAGSCCCGVVAPLRALGVAGGGASTRGEPPAHARQGS
jgi:hypothetical protein